MPLRSFRISHAALQGMALAVVLCGLALAVGCARTPRSRVLADHIRSVYVPMAHNRSWEPEVEEHLTRAIIENILEDGRMTVGREREADMVLEVVFREYRTRVMDHEDDDFPWRSEVILRADVVAYDPYDYDRRYPLGTWEDLEVVHNYQSDYRRTQRLIDVDEKQQAIQRLANRIIAAVLYEYPTDLSDIQERDASDREMLRARERQVRFRSAYTP